MTFVVFVVSAIKTTLLNVARNFMLEFCDFNTSC